MATSRAVAAVKRAKVVEAVADGATYEQAPQKAGYAKPHGDLFCGSPSRGDRSREVVEFRSGLTSGGKK